MKVQMPLQVHMPLAKPQPWVMPVTLVCLALGALIGLMIKDAGQQMPTSVQPGGRPEDLVRYYLVENEKLKAQIVDTQDKYESLLNSVTSDQKVQKEMLKEIEELRMRSGLSAMEGPGIVITLDDSQLIKPGIADLDPNALIVHDIDLLQLVNELRAAGAEGIAINDQRVAGVTAIRCVGPAIKVNDRPVAAPFVVRVIGKPDVLAGAVNLPQGLLDQLKALGVKVTVAKDKKVSVPSIMVLPPIEVGKPVKEEKPTQ